MDDMIGIQNCNLICLPENYTFKYYYYHYLSWPTLIFVAEDVASKKIVGYVLAKIDEEEETGSKDAKGHITSLSVLREYRRLGIARKLMEATHKVMVEEYSLVSVTLHVRVSNVAALGLYKDKLKYEQLEIDEGYYLDGEDAYMMKKKLI